MASMQMNVFHAHDMASVHLTWKTNTCNVSYTHNKFF